MRASDLDQAEHYSKELAKLRAALASATSENVAKVRLFFLGAEFEEVDAEATPHVDIRSEDREFQQIRNLARACVQRDLSEVEGSLRALDVDTGASS